jgi:uncharacterized protein (TIGR02266 family)
LAKGEAEAAPPERAYERYEVEIRVDWVSGQMFVSDHVTNIGGGGLFIRSEQPPVHGDVEMVLWLPGRSPVRVTGRVVWTHDPSRAAGSPIGGAGVSFIDMHPADRALLHEYLRDLGRREPARGH